MKYSKIINTIKKAEPVLENAEELTDNIMRKVEQMPGGIRQSRIFRNLGIISGAAASLLISLFAYETIKFPMKPVEYYHNNSFTGTTFLQKIHSPEISELNISEKEKVIESVIKNKEARRIRNEQLKNSISRLDTK